jgi:hypothetical protein
MRRYQTKTIGSQCAFVRIDWRAFDARPADVNSQDDRHEVKSFPNGCI